MILLFALAAVTFDGTSGTLPRDAGSADAQTDALIKASRYCSDKGLIFNVQGALDPKSDVIPFECVKPGSASLPDPNEVLSD
jgi:hypothetical protein